MVGKYRSRKKIRKSLPRHAPTKGGSVEKNIKLAVGFDHHHEDLQEVANKMPEAARFVKNMIKSNTTKDLFIPQFPKFQMKHPDRSVDIARMAKKIAKTHVHNFMPRKGGGIGLSQAVEAVKKLADPVEELKSAKSHYDGVNLHPTSFRGAVKSGLNAYAGNFALAAAHSKTASIVAPEMMPAAQGFSYASKGLGWVSKRI